MIKYLPKLLSVTFFLLLLNQQLLLAQVHLTATISPATIGKNETAELRLMIENAHQVDQIIPPALKDFNILSGPNQESGMENNNGVTKQYIGITYIIKPKAKGKFNIGPAIAKADGKTIKSNSVSIKVTNAVAGGNSQNSNNSPFGGLSSLFDEPPVQQTDNRDFILKKGENIQAKISKNIFIKLTMDKTTCFIGEPVIVTYKLYTRLKSESSITKNPYFNGFSVIDLVQPGNASYDVEKLNGREYNVYTLRKAQLYPLQAGAVEVEVAEVENTVHFIKEDYLKSHQGDLSDVMNGLPAEAMQDEKVTIQSKPLTINVKALPETDKPASFKGAVGSFTITAAVEKNNFTTDDAGKLEVVVSGQGNMELINAPDVQFPDSMESFEPTVAEFLNKQKVPVSGRKTFTYSFTVAKPGDYTLPPITYSFFNVAAAKYQTVTTEPIKISVKKGIGKFVVSKKSNPDIIGSPGIFGNFLNAGLLVAIIFAALICLLLFLWKRKKRVNQSAAEPEQKQPLVLQTAELASNPLALTEERMIHHDSKGFYGALNIEMQQFLSKKLNIPSEAITKKRISEELDKQGISLSDSLQITSLMNDVEMQLYSPVGDEGKMQEIYEKSNGIVRSFNGQTPNV